MFPDLQRRSWLQTDVKDTTSQALVIRYAASGSPEAEEVVVHSWNLDQIKRLVDAASPANERNYLRVSYLPHEVVVDGTDGVFAAEDANEFRFDRKQHLRPLPAPYRLSSIERADVQRIRSLTVKVEQAEVQTSPVLSINGDDFTALQLRTVVKDVELTDPYHNLTDWSRQPAENLSALRFIDTPGLGVTGSIKDEVLRHILEKKSERIVLELLREDELDIIIHLVLCGENSQFAQLWGAVAGQCGEQELADISERLILAINGTNKFFTNQDMTDKWRNSAAADSKADHFSTCIEDNILKRMSERGTIRPARVCFIDSRRFVEANQHKTYAQFYAENRPTMEAWCRPGGAGYKSLERLGLLHSFTENIGPLCDPDDRGQGYLVRSVLELIREKGPRLFLRKTLIRSGLFMGVRRLGEILQRYYGPTGQLNFQVVRDALQKCRVALVGNELEGIERLARTKLDPEIDTQLVGGAEKPVSEKWASEAFKGLCQLIFGILAKHLTGGAIQTIFQKYLEDVMGQWRKHWGYQAASLTPPTRQRPETADLLRHCLKFHARELLYQLFAGATAENKAQVPHNAEDKVLIGHAINLLDQVHKQAESLCRRQGIEIK